MAAWRWARHSRIIDMGERHTGFGQVGKTPQLERGTIEFAIQAHRAQRGFRVGMSTSVAGSVSYTHLTLPTIYSV